MVNHPNMVKLIKHGQPFEHGQLILSDQQNCASIHDEVNMKILRIDCASIPTNISEFR
jgi:hypothetical protein